MDVNAQAVYAPMLAAIIERLNALDSRISKLEMEKALDKRGKQPPLKGNILYKDNNVSNN